MPLFHIVILALIQGISEFLPISSSGHLVLAHYVLDGGNHDLCWSQNRMLDVAVHVGTLFSVLLYFRRDLIMMFIGVISSNSESLGMIKNIIIASIPVVIAGFFINQMQFSFLCLLEVMAWMTLIFGIVLWISDRFETTLKLESMKPAQAIIIGLSQALALIPGVSRSGVTMTSARFIGFSRVEAARFSMLLSIIAISGAGVLGAYDLFETGNFDLSVDILVAVFLSFISGFIAIHMMMKWLSHATFKPFAIYRIILGIALLALVYSGIF